MFPTVLTTGWFTSACTNNETWKRWTNLLICTCLETNFDPSVRAVLNSWTKQYTYYQTQVQSPISMYNGLARLQKSSFYWNGIDIGKFRLTPCPPRLSLQTLWDGGHFGEEDDILENVEQKLFLLLRQCPTTKMGSFWYYSITKYKVRAWPYRLGVYILICM